MTAFLPNSVEAPARPLRFVSRMSEHVAFTGKGLQRKEDNQMMTNLIGILKFPACDLVKNAQRKLAHEGDGVLTKAIVEDEHLVVRKFFASESWRL